MTVKELIDKLKALKKPDAEVYVSACRDGTGCDTCGYGHGHVETDVREVLDMETKVIVDTDCYV